MVSYVWVCAFELFKHIHNWKDLKLKDKHTNMEETFGSLQNLVDLVEEFWIVPLRMETHDVNK